VGHRQRHRGDNSACTRFLKKIRHMPMLSFTLQPQHQSEWCWAAITASLSKHYNPDSTWCQCKLATRLTKRKKTGDKDCCSHPYTKDIAHVCNQPQYLEQALRLIGRLAAPPITGPMTFGRIEKEILAGRPVCARIRWGRATVGHFVLIYGCRKSKRGGKWLYVEDSLYGNSTWLYGEFCSNYQYAEGHWSHTYPIMDDAKAKRDVKRAAA
jgi:hypothetical protein